VAVERPDREQRVVAGVIDLTDCAVATSGDYRHSIQWDGGDLSHTIDPRAGRPVSNRLASVTLLAPDCMRADAWATVLMVLGEERGPALAARMAADALFFARDGELLREIGVGRLAGAADPSGNERGRGRHAGVPEL
jgi:thiamine biosynthesis lipoprotein